MNARIHQGLAWVFVAAVACAAGCAASDGSGNKPAPAGTGKPEPGAPGAPGGKHKPGPGRERAGTPADCFGPSTLTTVAREQLAGRICAEIGRRPKMARRGRAGGVCASAYQVRSDAQIAGLLTAWNDAAIREGTMAQQGVADPAVRGLADQVVTAHTREKTDLDALFGRASIKPEQTPGSRSLEKGAFTAVCGPEPQGASIDREYVTRLVEGEHRSLSLVGALVSQAKAPGLRCLLVETHVATRARLERACTVWSSIKGTVGTARSADEEADEIDADETDEAGDVGEVDCAGEP